MADFVGEDLGGALFERADLREARFARADLSGSLFERVNFEGARFDRVDLRGAEFRGAELVDVRLRDVQLRRVVLRGAELADVEINGEIGRLVVNGVDVAPLVEAELDRRDPERTLIRPTDADGCRAAWDMLERRWAATVERARWLDPALLHESADGEWTFVETLRHLVFATDAWLLRTVLGDPAPWDPLGLPWDQMPDTPGLPRNRAARPSLDEVLALRRERMAAVRDYVDTLTDDEFGGLTDPVEGPGWPGTSRYPVAECLRTIFVEEWEHRRYAERDLDILVARST